MAKTFRKQDEHFESFNELIEAAKYQYTLSLKEACMMLKCSRSWAQKYIRPHVKSIYLSNGMNPDKPGVDYARIVSEKIHRDQGESGYSKESIYLDTEEFYSHIKDHIKCCQKRSKRVYKSFFVEPSKLEAYYIELLDLYVKFADERNTTEMIKLRAKIDTLFLDHASNDYVRKIIYPAIVHSNKRTEAEFADVPLPDEAIANWKAVHDMLDYGDTEEPIYRGLFADGYIRIELCLPDADGVIASSGKVYYINDPEEILQPQISDSMRSHILSRHSDPKEVEELFDQILKYDRINIKQTAWYEYNKQIGNPVKY